MRLQNAPSSATPGPSNTGPQSVSTTEISEDGSLSQMQSCSPFEEVVLPTVVPKPRPKPRPKGKAKAKETIIEPKQNTGPALSLPLEVGTIDEGGTTSESQIVNINNGSTTPPTHLTAPRPVPKPKPIPRAKGKSAAIKNSLRGSKRKIDTQVDKAPVAKKRKTQGPKPGLIPASEPVNMAIASASVSLPQSVDATLPHTVEIMEDKHPERTLKMTLRVRKIATAAKNAPVKRSRRRTCNS